MIFSITINTSNFITVETLDCGVIWNLWNFITFSYLTFAGNCAYLHREGSFLMSTSVFLKNFLHCMLVCMNLEQNLLRRRRRKAKRSMFPIYLIIVQIVKISMISSMHPFSAGKRRNLLNRLIHHQFLLMNFSHQGNSRRVKFNNTRMSKHIYFH